MGFQEVRSDYDLEVLVLESEKHFNILSQRKNFFLFWIHFWVVSQAFKL